MWNNSGIVKEPFLQLKEHPSADSQTVDEALYGMEVLIREKTAGGGWVSVETAYGYQGYVRGYEPDDGSLCDSVVRVSGQNGEYLYPCFI